MAGLAGIRIRRREAELRQVMRERIAKAEGRRCASGEDELQDLCGLGKASCRICVD